MQRLFLVNLFADLTEINDYASKVPLPQQALIELKLSCSLVVERLALHHQYTHNLTVEESPGYLYLGALLCFFAKSLSGQLGMTYKHHAQHTEAKNNHPGQNPSILRALSGTCYVAKVVYMYKLAINPLVSMVDTKHLIELFLQCHYMIKYEGISRVLGCLTDMVTWHYFELTLNDSRKVDILWCFTFKMTLPAQKKEIENQLSFLVHCLSK